MQEIFKNKIVGKVIDSKHPEYMQILKIDNGRVNRCPKLVVQPIVVEDIIETLRYCQDENLKFTVKSGGHSDAGYCLNDGGVVLDFSLMKSVSLNRTEMTISVQAGARWSDVYNFLRDNAPDWLVVGGACSSVGVPGFTLGGGFGFLSRSYGLAVDNLQALTIVTADGKVRYLSAKSVSREERDLFWACRGGGGGNFGVAVEMVFRLHKPMSLDKNVLKAQIDYPADKALAVLEFYNQWIETLPDQLSVYGMWSSRNSSENPHERGQFIGLTCIYNGDFAEGMKLIMPLLSRELGHQSAQINHLNYYDFEKINENTRKTIISGRKAYMRSGVMSAGGMKRDVIDLIKYHMLDCPSSESLLVWMHSGGAINKVSSDETAFPHRNARFVFHLKAIWHDSKEERLNVAWAHQFFSALEPHLSGAYLNYIDPLQKNWTKNYYGDNYARLLAVKQYFDPDNLFRFQQSVGSEFEADYALNSDLKPLNRTFYNQ